MEEWKEIEGYEGLYKISNLGKVINFHFSKDRIIKTRRERVYSKIDLFINGLRKTYSIHRLVAIHFVENPDNLPCVLHKKEDLDEKGLLDNGYYNLKWGTLKDNSQDMICKGRRINPSKGKFGANSKCSKIVYQYNLDGEFIREWGSVTDAKKGTGANNISACCRGIVNYSGLFIWSYKLTI